MHRKWTYSLHDKSKEQQDFVYLGRKEMATLSGGHKNGRRHAKISHKCRRMLRR